MRCRRGVVLILTVALQGAGIAGTAHAAAAQTRAVQLALRDRQAIAAIVCTPVGSAGLDSAAGPRPGGANGRSVLSIRCQPHGSEADVPLVRVARCTRKAGKWDCGDFRDALRMKLPDGTPLALVAEAVPSRQAMKAVFEAASLAVPPFQTPASQILQDQCTLRQSGDKAFKGAVHFDVECTRGTLAITRDCWNSRCRFFVTGGSRRE